jgi:hypothetical protein
VVIKNKGQMKIMQMVGVAREIELVDQNCLAILDRKSFGNESRNFQYVRGCAA